MKNGRLRVWTEGIELGGELERACSYPRCHIALGIGVRTGLPEGRMTRVQTAFLPQEMTTKGSMFHSMRVTNDNKING